MWLTMTGKFTLSVSLALASIPINAAYHPKKVGWWEIYQYERSCEISTKFNNQFSIAFSQEWFTEEVDLVVMKDDWAALNDRTQKGVDIEVKFSGDVEYDEFGNRPAIVVHVPPEGEEKGHTGIFAMWERADGKRLLESLAISNSFTLTVDDRLLDFFSAKGTHDAVSELYQCIADGRRNSLQNPVAE